MYIYIRDEKFDNYIFMLYVLFIILYYEKFNCFILFNLKFFEYGE